MGKDGENTNIGWEETKKGEHRMRDEEKGDPGRGEWIESLC
jgi:hypothetical protein